MADIANYQAGTKYAFKAYDDGSLTEGQAPIFQPGEVVIIVETPASQNIFDNNGVKVKSATDDRTDTLFDTEMEPNPVEAAPAAAPATRTRGGKAAGTAKLPAAGKGKGKGKAAAKEKTKKVKTEKEPIALVKTEHVQAILAETPDVMQAIAGLQDDIEQTYFSLGGLYAMVLHEGLYKTEFPEKGGFNDWCDKHTGQGHRQVRHLINIYTKVTAAGFDEKELEKIGHTKARVLASHMEHKDFDYKKEIKYAETHTREQIEDHMKKTYVKATKGGTAGSTTPKEETVKRVKFGPYTMYGDSATMGESAFKKAAELAESEDPNKAFEQIITDWASLTGGVETTLEQEVARLNAKFNVTLGLVEADEAEGEAETETTAEAPAAEAPAVEAAPAAKKTRSKKAA